MLHHRLWDVTTDAFEWGLSTFRPPTSLLLVATVLCISKTKTWFFCPQELQSLNGCSTAQCLSTLAQLADALQKVKTSNTLPRSSGGAGTEKPYFYRDKERERK